MRRVDFLKLLQGKILIAHGLELPLNRSGRRPGRIQAGRWGE
jgi:hypothetical protein